MKLRLPFLAALALLSLGASGPGSELPLGHQTDLHGDPLPPGAIARFGTLRWRTGTRCTALAYLPDGKSLLSVDSDNGCCVWDVATGKKLRQFGSFLKGDVLLGPDRGAAISPDKQLVATHGERTVDVWDVRSGQRLWCNEQPDLLWVVSVAFSPDGKTLATRQYRSATVELLDALSGQPLRRLPVPDQKKAANIDGPVRFARQGMEFSPDGKLLAVAPERNPFCVYEVESGKSLPGLPEKLDSIDWLVHSPDKKWLAWRENEAIFLVDRNWTAKPLAPAGGVKRFACLSFSPDSKTLACLGCDGQLHCWDVATGASKLDPPRLPVAGGWESRAVMAIAPDSRTVAVSRGPAIWFYDLQTGKQQTVEHGQSSWIKAADLSGDGKSLVSCSWDNALCVWDTSTSKLLKQAAVPGGGYYPSRPLFAPDGKSFVVTDYQGQVALFETATAIRLRTFQAPDVVRLPPASVTGACVSLVGQLAPPAALAGQAALFKTLVEVVPERTTELLQFSRDGKTLLTRQEHALVWWDVTTGKPTRRFLPQGDLDGYDPEIAGETSRFLKVTGMESDQEVAIWKPGELEPLWQVPMPSESKPTFDPLGKNLAILSPHWKSNGEGEPATLFRMIEALTGKERCRFRGALDALVQSLLFSPDGRTIATLSTDGSMRLWDIATQRELCRWQPSVGTRTFFFSRDGKRMVTGGDDTTLLLWDVATLTQSIKAAAPPALPDVELGKLWNDLGAANAGLAFDAVCTLTTVPDKALPLIAGRWQSAPDVGPKQIEQWINELDSDTYAVRQKASRELENNGRLAKPALLGALKVALSLEQRRRIELLLPKIDHGAALSAELRGLRALEILEIIGTREALRVAETLVTGALETLMRQETAITVQKIKSRLADDR